MAFSFREIAVLSQELGISLDALLTQSTLDTTTQNLLMIENLHEQTDISLLAEFANLMKKVTEKGYSEGGELTNILPLPVYINYESLTRFYIFKWRYQSFSNTKIPVHYKDIVITDKIREITAFNLKVAHNISYTHYIFDHSLFAYIIQDIKYSRNIGLMTPEDVGRLKEDLLHVIDDLEQLCETGTFQNTGNKVNVYISSVNFDTSYWYIQSEELYIAVIKIFILNGIVAKDIHSFEKIKEWVLSLKRHSTLISESSEKERILYLNKQRELINRL